MGGYGDVPGTAEDSSALLPLMAMIRQGELSQDVKKLFQKYAHQAPKKEPVAPCHPSWWKVKDLERFLTELQQLVGVQLPQLQPREKINLKSLQELLWSCAMDGATKAAALQPAKKKRSLHELFQVVTRLGEGATGNVILAKDRETEQRRAVKVVHKTPGGESLTQQQLKVQEEFFRREVKVLSTMDHPHIIRLHQHFEDQQGWYLVLEYCPCGDLTALMEEYRADGHACPCTGLTQMPWLFTLKVTFQVLLALAHMHRRKVMHLDIKGQNIMFQVSYRDTIMPGERAAHPAPTLVMKEPHVVLVDFGTAQGSDTPESGPIGTCAFMAPEVWKSKLTPKADIFGLGVVVFQMMGGKMPFSVPNSIDLAQEYWSMEPLPPWNDVPYVAPQGQEVCNSMLQIQSRPSAEELLEQPIFSDLRTQEEQTDGIPLHYAHRLVNYAERDVLQKCCRMRLARAWTSNQMPRFRRLYVSLCDGCGRLTQERLGAALSAALAAGAGALSAAQTWNVALRGARALVDQDGLVGFTHFVAALADLGDPKYEDFLLRSFEQVDEDDDGLLGVEDLAKLLSADAKKHAVLLQEFMVALTGHDSPGAKFEFQHFLRHFQKRDEAERAPREASESPEAPSGKLQGADPFFQNFAGTLLDQAVEEMKSM
mmetsp:Transcript_40321/g.87275  ORF Transcript_40321/g.87275 Transcript_40321/m.87275 type:complete len:653 (-) Transcript_40321:65-2023(-)